jgi:hypothetical protein
MVIARGATGASDKLYPGDKLKIAYFHLVKGIAQHTLADMFNVNPGRIAEAIKPIAKAAGYEEGA